MIQSTFLAAYTGLRGFDVVRLFLGGHLSDGGVHPCCFVRQNRCSEVQFGCPRVVWQFVWNCLWQFLRQSDDDALHRGHNPPCNFYLDNIFIVFSIVAFFLNISLRKLLRPTGFQIADPNHRTAKRRLTGLTAILDRARRWHIQLTQQHYCVSVLALYHPPSLSRLVDLPPSGTSRLAVSEVTASLSIYRGQLRWAWASLSCTFPLFRLTLHQKNSNFRLLASFVFMHLRHGMTPLLNFESFEVCCIISGIFKYYRCQNKNI